MSEIDTAIATDDFLNPLIQVTGKFALRDTADNARQVLKYLEMTKDIKNHEEYVMVKDARDLIRHMAIEAIDYVKFELTEKKI